ncbi:MAG TPA: RDD family protein [Nocardioidaceae bacterium]|nr:RDD family protein [Nocardioidaceae bacterium]
MTQIPSGWYPDPAPAQPGQPPMVRYWDGAVWTEHVAPAAPPAAPVAPTQPVYGAPAYATPAYGTPVPQTPPGPTTPDGERLAGWWWRVGAYVVDSLALGAISQIVALPFTFSFNSDIAGLMDEWEAADQAGTLDPDEMFNDLGAVFEDHLFGLVFPPLVAGLLYFALFWRFLGATPGQLLFGLRVRLREHPGKLPLSVAIVRWFFLIGLGSLSLVAFTFSWEVALLVILLAALYGILDPLWATWDSKRQTIHDKIARTNVVKVR